MAKNNRKTPSAKSLRDDLTRLNTLARRVLTLASASTNSDRDNERELIRKEVENIIKKDLKSYTDLEGKDLSTLLARYVTKNNKLNTEKLNSFQVEDIFENESNGLVGHFRERYRNENLQLEDLYDISSQMYELREAIEVTRDAILSSDDMTATVSRSISFMNENVSEDDLDLYIKKVEELEEKHNIPQKLKNHIVPKTLIYGRYYVYTIPYKDIFAKHMYRKLKDHRRPVRESYYNTDDLVSILEQYGVHDNDMKKKVESYKDTANDLLQSVTVNNDTIPIPLLESGVVELLEELDISLGDDKELAKVAKKAFNNRTKRNVTSPDGVVDINDAKNKDLDFSDFDGCYVELIDPRKIIPLKIMNMTVGYYYIHDEPAKKVRTPFTTNLHIDMTLNSKDVETKFLLDLTEKIVKDFDKKYLEENVAFKEAIMHALIYHDIYKKDIKFQFIPAKYITEFTVDEDENGNGTSVLINSLFYAKLYLALLIFKMISIIARSNDQRLYYIRTSGMSTDVTNKVQDVVRQMKQREINFTDLLNYKSIVTKVGAYKDIYMPVGPDDVRGIEFDIMAGQDIQIHNDFMESLKTAAINATSVPSVIMQYINEVDYARTLEMANAKFLQRVISRQIDVNRSTTELYRKIIRYSNTEIPDEVTETLVYKLTTPSTLQSVNMANLINDIQTRIDFIVRARMGENSEPTELDNIAKDILFRRLAKMEVGSIRWDAINGMIEDVYVEAKEEIEKRNKIKENENQ